MSSTAQPVDVNAAFAAERAEQIHAADARQADFDARVAAGRLIPSATAGSGSTTPAAGTTVKP